MVISRHLATIATEMQAPDSSIQVHHLPQQVTSFVGREQELVGISRRLLDPACRLLTLVGPGGMGKTRLAIQATAVAAPHFPAGATFINLQSVETEAHLLTAIADALDISLTRQESPLACIRDRLADRPILLILDNFEQLLAAASVLSDLLIETRVKFLVTSRETLKLQEEWLYPLGSLNYPTQPPARDELTSFSAIQLFADRVQRIRPDFSLETEAEAVVRICRMVEGMPLALELAAPWMRSMSCGEIAAEIERNRNFLATRLRNVPERHRSLQAIFAQTWAGLDESERAVFPRLAVFRDGFLRDAAEAVAGASLPLLSSLMDKSLLRWEVDDAGNGRYQIHELLRQYAAEKLFAQPDIAAETLARHANHYAGLLKHHLDNLLGGGQLAAMRHIDAEMNNIRAAWQWAVKQDQWSIIDDALESLHLFCDMQGRHVEGIALFQTACQKLSTTVDDQTRPILGQLLSRYRFMQVYSATSPDEMAADLQRSLAIAKEQNDHLEIGLSLLALGGFTFYVKNEPQAAITLFEQSLPLFQAQNHTLYEARALTWLGVADANTENLLRYCQAILEIARPSGNKADMAITLGNLVEVALTIGDYALAETYCDEAIAIADEMHFRLVAAHTRTLLSMIYFLRGEWVAATELIQRSRALVKDLNNGMAIGYAEGIAGLYESITGNYVQGRRLCESSQANQANHGLGVIAACWGLATAYCGMQNDEAAWQAVRQGIHQALVTDSTAMALWLLPVTAVLLHRQSQSPQAARLLALAATHPQSPTGWMAHWVLLKEVQEALQDEMETAVQQAPFLSLETILVEIMADDSEIDVATAANQSLIAPLTDRELEVLHLIANGLTNQQIADSLVIAKGTVKYYTSNIYSKLQVASRTQAVAQARELGILLG